MCKGRPRENEESWESRGAEDKPGSPLPGMDLGELIKPGGRQGDLFYASSRPTSVQLLIHVNRHVSLCVDKYISLPTINFEIAVYIDRGETPPFTRFASPSLNTFWFL